MRFDVPSTRHLLAARILIGLVVLVCAEVFSGASLHIGLWNPWTILVTYWLYFAHFFFFTTLAVSTGRTSLSSLYLWGVLFGLYESWITKVIWYGYGGDGKLAMGQLGPYGFSEISMVFFFHPVISFILPLAVTCLLCTSLRREFPDLAWLTGTSRGARVALGYLVFSLAPVMAINSEGPLNLAANIAAAGVLFIALWPLARPAFVAPDARSVVVFGRRGFIGLCVYLAVFYGVAYFALRPEGRPSIGIQLFTFVFYACAIAGLKLHRKRQPLLDARVENREMRLIAKMFAGLLVLGFAISTLGRNPALFPAVALNFFIWTMLGFVLTILAIAKGAREWFANGDSGVK